jgi:hypothetical protein
MRDLLHKIQMFFWLLRALIQKYAMNFIFDIPIFLKKSRKNIRAFYVAMRQVLRN